MVYINSFAIKNLYYKKNSCKQLTTQYTITDIVLMYFPALSTAARPAHLVISARLHLGSGVTTLDPAQPGYKQQAAAS